MWDAGPAMIGGIQTVAGTGATISNASQSLATVSRHALIGLADWQASLITRHDMVQV